MQTISLQFKTPSKLGRPERLSLALNPFQGRPKQSVVAEALYECHLSDPEKLDDSWEFPSLESRPSSTSIAKSYEVTRPLKDERAKKRKEVLREQNGTISELMRVVEELSQRQSTTDKALKRFSRISDDHKISVKKDIEKAEEEVEDRKGILWFETIERALRGMNDTIMDVMRASSGGRRVLTKAEKQELKDADLGYITEILAASKFDDSDDTSVSKNTRLARNALECLSFDEICLATKCIAIHKNLRKARNDLQHPRPSKDYSLRLLSEHSGEFSNQEFITLQACIATSRRLPRRDASEKRTSDLNLFGERPDAHTEKLEANLKDLKERNAILEDDGPNDLNPMKRTLMFVDENSEEQDDDEHLSKKLKLSADT